MLENREVTKRIFPGMLADSRVRMINNYPLLLQEILASLAPQQIANATVVLLTPGVFNSAYFEHTFLSRQMGIPLVEGRDLLVDNHKVYMKTKLPLYMSLLMFSYHCTYFLNEEFY